MLIVNGPKLELWIAKLCNEYNSFGMLVILENYRRQFQPKLLSHGTFPAQ
jgi:hypothetical protein